MSVLFKSSSHWRLLALELFCENQAWVGLLSRACDAFLVSISVKPTLLKT
jgi:hypothetical protein